MPGLDSGARRRSRLPLRARRIGFTTLVMSTTVSCWSVSWRSRASRLRGSPGRRAQAPAPRIAALGVADPRSARFRPPGTSGRCRSAAAGRRRARGLGQAQLAAHQIRAPGDRGGLEERDLAVHALAADPQSVETTSCSGAMCSSARRMRAATFCGRSHCRVPWLTAPKQIFFGSRPLRDENSSISAFRKHGSLVASVAARPSRTRHGSM